MTNSELTVLHAETLAALAAASKKSRTLANISRRAANLIADGYQIRAFADADCYVVESPKGDKYVVWHGLETGFDCSCPCFKEWNTCKHLEAVDLMKQDEADAEKLDAMADEADYDRYAYRY